MSRICVFVVRFGRIHSMYMLDTLVSTLSQSRAWLSFAFCFCYGHKGGLALVVGTPFYETMKTITSRMKSTPQINEENQDHQDVPNLESHCQYQMILVYPLCAYPTFFRTLESHHSPIFC